MGTAYLVGAGPGDPKLITRRGEELLRRADVVLHDALVDQELLALASHHAEIIDVGRRAGETRWLTQERINRLLVQLARRHRVVVRLKGGDPLVFGRGGEEALALKQAGIPFEIVPGVTAGIGALAYAGIPLTHRGVAATAAFVTAHDQVESVDKELWRHLAELGGTVVVYMGAGRIREVTDRLIRLGRSADTPAAVVESGTLPRQRVVLGTLGDLADRSGERSGPALIVVGEVARFGEEIDWLQRGPLVGRSVLVARARPQRSWIAGRLRELGASVVEFPTIRTHVGPDADAVPEAVARQGGRGAVVFTGPAAVAASTRALRRGGLDARALAGLQLVAIGRETIAALRRAGLRRDVALRSYLPIRVTAVLTRALGPLDGLPVLLVRDGEEPSALAAELTAAGARVAQLQVANRTIDGRGCRHLERLIAARQLDAVVLPSSSAAEALVSGGLSLPSGLRVFAIGPATAATAARLGLPTARVPQSSGADGLIADVLGVLTTTAVVAPPRASASSD